MGLDMANELNQLLGDISCDTITYKNIQNTDLKLLFVKPTGWSEEDSRTAIVFIHGGGWTTGDPKIFLPHCKFFANRGMVGFSVDYRLYCEKSGNTLNNCIDDCKASIQFIRQHAEELGINPQKIIVVGESAGGHLAACLSNNSIGAYLVDSVPNAIICFNAIFDMTIRREDVIPLNANEMDDASKWMQRYYYAKSLSPMYHIEADQPLMLILHGLTDVVVDPAQAVLYYEMTKAVGNTAEIILIPHALHSFILFNYQAEAQDVYLVLTEVQKFLEKQILL